MDCRRSLSYLVALALAAVAGCAPTKLFPLAPGEKSNAELAAQSAASSSVPAPATEAIAKEPVKELKPATLVAMAAFHEQMANELARDPAEKLRILEEARLSYERAIEADPKQLPGYIGLARHWEMRERHDLALRYYEEAARLGPHDAGIVHEMGMCHARHKEWEPALARLYRAVELDHDNRQYAMNFALCLGRAERFDESLAWLRKLENEAEAQFSLARMLHHLGKYDRCLEHVRLALAADPMFVPAQEMLTSLTAPAPAAPAAEVPQVTSDAWPPPVAAPVLAAAATVTASPPTPETSTTAAAPAPPAPEPPAPDENLVRPTEATPPASPTADQFTAVGEPAAKPGE